LARLAQVKILGFHDPQPIWIDDFPQPADFVFNRYAMQVIGRQRAKRQVQAKEMRSRVAAIFEPVGIDQPRCIIVGMGLDCLQQGNVV